MSSFLINGINATCLAGTIVAYVGIYPPIGWAMCDGSAYDAVANPFLDKALGYPTQKNLPNLNAFFLRGSETAPSNLNYQGGNVRSMNNDSIKSHNHTTSERNHSHGYYRLVDISISYGDTQGLIGSGSSTTTDNTTIGVTIDNTGESETRPFCYGINYIIKL